MARTCIIINPNAGAKGGLTVNAVGIEDVEATLAEIGLPATIMPTERAGHATSLAAEALAQGYERIVAAGGDGTVREVAEALIGSDACLGILPLGSAMNTARALGVPLDLSEAVALIRDAARTAPIDIGRVADRLLLEAGGVGVSAGVIYLLSGLDAGRWDRLRTLATYLRQTRRVRVTIETDRQTIACRTFSLVIANAPYTGARVTIAPDAKMNDGQFDIKIFQAQTKAQLAVAWMQVIFLRRRRSPQVMSLRAATVQVGSDRPMLVHADDELAGRTPVRFELLPGAVRAIVGPEAPGL